MDCILETQRLKLREFSIGDATFIIDLVNSPGWIQFIGDRNVKSVEQAEEYLRSGPLKSYRQFGYGLWLVETKYGKSVGMCGLLKRDSLEFPDLGFAFLPEAQGVGYAYEISFAVVEYARRLWKMETLAAIVLPENIRSIELLKKLKFFLSGSYPAPDDRQLDLYRYEYGKSAGITEGTDLLLHE